MPLPRPDSSAELRSEEDGVKGPKLKEKPSAALEPNCPYTCEFHFTEKPCTTEPGSKSGSKKMLCTKLELSAVNPSSCALESCTAATVPNDVLIRVEPSPKFVVPGLKALKSWE